MILNLIEILVREGYQIRINNFVLLVEDAL